MNSKDEQFSIEQDKADDLPAANKPPSDYQPDQDEDNVRVSNCSNIEEEDQAIN